MNLLSFELPSRILCKEPDCGKQHTHPRRLSTRLHRRSIPKDNLQSDIYLRSSKWASSLRISYTLMLMNMSCSLLRKEGSFPLKHTSLQGTRCITRESPLSSKSLLCKHTSPPQRKQVCQSTSHTSSCLCTLHSLLGKRNKWGQLNCCSTLLSTHTGPKTLQRESLCK